MTRRLWKVALSAGMACILSALPTSRMVAQTVGDGVTLERMTYSVADSLWTFVYAARNPSRRYGVSQTVVVEAWAPKRVGSELLPMPRTRFLGDGTGTPDADVGHVPLAIESPSGAFAVTITPEGDISWRVSSDSLGRTNLLQPGEVVRGFIVHARGIPVLREATLQPFRPLPRYGTDETSEAPVLVYPPGTRAGELLTSLLPGPGIPAAVVSAVSLQDQFESACGYGLITPLNCRRANAILAKLAPTRARVNPARLLTLLSGRNGATHPFVAQTIGLQLRAVHDAATRKGPIIPS
jgi:hypothetical protein